MIVTLRADFFDRPLAVPELAELMRTRTATVVPLTPEELERAIDGPAAQVGVVPELRSWRRWSRTCPSDRARFRSCSSR